MSEEEKKEEEAPEMDFDPVDSLEDIEWDNEKDDYVNNDDD